MTKTAAMTPRTMRMVMEGVELNGTRQICAVAPRGASRNTLQRG